MSDVVPLPSFGEVFFDVRGEDRVLRVTWHAETLVLSVWRGEMCTGSFRMSLEDVDRLIDTLDDGLAEEPEYDDEPEHEPDPAATQAWNPADDWAAEGRRPPHAGDRLVAGRPALDPIYTTGARVRPTGGGGRHRAGDGYGG